MGELAGVVHAIGSLEACFDQPCDDVLRVEGLAGGQFQPTLTQGIDFGDGLVEGLDRSGNHAAAGAAGGLRQLQHQTQPLRADFVGQVVFIARWAFPDGKGLSRGAAKSLQVVADAVGIVDVRTDIQQRAVERFGDMRGQ